MYIHIIFYISLLKEQFEMKFIYKKLFYINLFLLYIYFKWGLGIGDWGLGIGDWAQSPIPNPQSPIPI